MAHHTKEKGDIGTLLIAADLAEQGLKVLFPASEHLPFDLAAYNVELNKFYRVQCKYRSAVDGRVEVSLRTSYSSASGVRSTRYEENSFDVIALYCPEVRAIAYLLESSIRHVKTSLILRIDGKDTGSRNIFDYSKFPE